MRCAGTLPCSMLLQSGGMEAWPDYHASSTLSPTERASQRRPGFSQVCCPSSSKPVRRFLCDSCIALARDRFETVKAPLGFRSGEDAGDWGRRAGTTAGLSEVAHPVLSASVRDAADADSRLFDSAAGRIKGRRVGRPQHGSHLTAQQAPRNSEKSFIIRAGWQNSRKGGGRLNLANSTKDVRVNWHRPLTGYPSAVTTTADADGTFWASSIVRVPQALANTPTRLPARLASASASGRPGRSREPSIRGARTRTSQARTCQPNGGWQACRSSDARELDDPRNVVENSAA